MLRAVFAERNFERSEQVALFERFEEKSKRVRLFGAFERLHISKRGQEDDRNILRRTDGAGRLDAINRTAKPDIH